MRKITKDTPRVTFTVHGVNLEVAEPFKDGDILVANEASVMNQTYRENIRNNNAKAIEKILEAAGVKLEDIKKGAQVPDNVVKDCQAVLDKSMETYVFGERQGGGGRIADPVRARAMVYARRLVVDEFKKQGKKAKDYTSAEVNKLAEKVVKAHPKLMEFAKKALEAEQNTIGAIELSPKKK